MKCPFWLLIVVIFGSSILGQSKTNVLPTDFRAVAMDGSTVDTTALRGKIVVLNLWFINCPNCIEEIKVLNQLVDEYKSNNDVVFLAPAANSKVDLDKFLINNPFRYQVIPNASAIILFKFGTPTKNGEVEVPFPMHLVLGRDGRIINRVQGIKGVDAVRAEITRQLAPGSAMRSRKALL